MRKFIALSCLLSVLSFGKDAGNDNVVVLRSPGMNCSITYHYKDGTNTIEDGCSIRDVAGYKNVAFECSLNDDASEKMNIMFVNYVGDERGVVMTVETIDGKTFGKDGYVTDLKTANWIMDNIEDCNLKKHLEIRRK